MGHEHLDLLSTFDRENRRVDGRVELVELLHRIELGSAALPEIT